MEPAENENHESVNVNFLTYADDNNFVYANERGSISKIYSNPEGKGSGILHGYCLLSIHLNDDIFIT